MAYSLFLFDHVENLAVLNDPYYCYLIQPGTFKGRSYDEMIDIYCTVFDMSAEYFKKWGLFSGNTKDSLINNVCERIANYSAYAFIVKYKEQKDNITKLFNNKKVRNYFVNYKNTKKSKFMFLFCLAMLLRNRCFMKFVCKLSRKKVDKNL